MAPQDPYNGGYGADGYNSEGRNRQGDYDATYDQSSPYYIDRGDTSITSEQAQRNAEQTADQQESGGTFIDDVIDIFTRQGRVDEAYDQELSGQAAELAQGVETRQPPMMMCSNYMSYDHGALKTMVTDGVDPDQVGQMGDKWIEAGNAMVRFQSGVATAINNSETDWQGEAGNSARKFMADVGNWVGTAGQSAQLAGTQTNIQAESLAEAKNTMPEPVEFDAAAANRDLQTTSNPADMMFKYANYMAQYHQQQAAHQQAAQVVGTYDSGLSGASQMPAFAPPPVMNNPNGGTSDPGTSNIDSMGPGGSVDSGGTGGSGGVGGYGDAGGGSGSGVYSVPTPNGGNGYDGSGNNGGSNGGNNWGGTGPSGDGLLPGPGPMPVPTPGPGPGPNPGNNQHFPGAPMPLGLGGGPGGPNDMERGGGRYGGGRGFGPGGGGGGFGSGGGAGSSGMGGRPGMGPMGGAGAMAAENAAMRGGGVGGAGAAGARGTGMMGGMGGGRGQGEDDEEHTRPSFLVEGDPDAVFGTDQMTAPPVIGE
ncbi:hypothetical protein [Actinophytocola gossypii]|uniref:PPE family domain-containing protein n=1 Tax=Actinophytocola gossypii TaxID=2812003 RepID=A0ABT2JDG4_9PSEU|nr:hypothetical protein [Actinophytocola gossypii]MCT2585922.1 hypothetical protein [Actinophytocola gossypii]